MNLRKTFVSAAAAVALASALVHGANVFAGESLPSASSGPAAAATATTRTTPSGTKDPALITARSVTIDPLVPVPIIVGLGGAYGLFCLIAARRKLKGTWLRAAAGGVLTLALLNPEIVEEMRQPLPTDVAIVVDKSASQSIDGRDKMTAAAYAEIVSRLSSIEGITIRTIDAGGTQTASDGDGTNLFHALDAGLADTPRDRLGAVIMLTDGQVHDAHTAQPDKTPGAGVPLHVLVSGRENETDRRIVIDESPRFAVVGQNQTIRFHVADNGSATASGGAARVTISHNGRDIATQSVTPGVPSGATVTIPHAGQNLVELKLAPVAGELTQINNRAALPIEGVRQNLNVLLITGSPHQGVRMWRDFLKADPAVNLIHFSTLRPMEKEDYTPLKDLSLIPFPAQEIFSEKLGKFDLVIFDRYEYDGLLPMPYFEKIAAHVKNGGALLVVSGRETAHRRNLYNTPLASVLPTAPERVYSDALYQPSVSDLGKRHPATRGLGKSATSGQPSWGPWAGFSHNKPVSGHILMTGESNKPLLVFSRQGKGRVAMLQSDGAWMWARGYDGGGPHAALLQNISRWLIQDPALEEESLHLQAGNGKLALEQQTLGDKGARIIVETPSGKMLTVVPDAAEPGLWRATIPADEPGLYRARLEGKASTPAIAHIGPANPKEFEDALSTTAILQPIAEKTGGGISRMANAAGALSLPRIVAVTEKSGAMAGTDWIGIRMRHASILKGLSQTPLLPPWLAAIFVIGLFAAAWYREGEGSLFRKKDNNAPAPR